VNICAVVTRYFGGVRLGIGGLIRAYKRSVAQTLLNLGTAKGGLKQEISCFVDYSLYGKIQHFFEIHPEYSVKYVLFTDKVEVKVFISEVFVEIFQEEVTNLLSGKVDFCLGEFSYHEVRMD
jgi:putative IMPACT (imprinted ancient) family translation regulator